MSTLGGCLDDLPSPSLIDGLRVVAIVADPPEAAPGKTVTLTPAVVDIEGRPLTYRWSACLVPAGAEHEDPNVDPGNCNDLADAGDTSVIDLGTGATAQLTIPADFFDDPSVLADAYGFGGEISPEMLGMLATLIGVELRVSLDITAGDASLATFKRVKVSSSPAPNDNPAPVAFVLRQTTPVASRPDDFVAPDVPTEYELPPAGGCLVSTAEGPTMMGTGSWEIVPVNIPETMATYKVVGLSTAEDQPYQVVDVDEVYTFSLFSRGGSLQEKASTAEETGASGPGSGGGGGPTGVPTAAPEGELPGTAGWTFEEAPGMNPMPLWIVTRDGRGGTTWCYSEIPTGNAN